MQRYMGWAYKDPEQVQLQPQAWFTYPQYDKIRRILCLDDPHDGVK